MRVPEYEGNVGLDVPQAPAPRLSPVVREAFGESVYAAKAQTGEVAMKALGVLQAHFFEQRRQKEAAQLADLDTSFRLNLQNKLTNKTIEKTKVHGQEVERPAGLLSRSLTQADGATQEFDKYYQDTRQSYVSNAPNKEMAQKLGAQMDLHYLSSRDMVIKHEAKEGKAVLVKSQMANLDQQIHDAAAINDPLQLLAAVNKAKATQGQISGLVGADPETTALKQKDRAGDVVSKAVNTALLSSGLDKAKQLLEVAKDDIQPDRYERLSSQLTTGSDKIQKAQERAQLQDNIGKRANYLADLAAGKLSWINIDDVSNTFENDPKFAEAAIKALEEKDDLDISKQNEHYPAFVESIYKAQDQEQLHKNLLNVLNNQKNISQEKLSILFNMALQRGKSLPLSTNNLNPGEGEKVDPKQNEVDSGAKSILFFGRQSKLNNTQISDQYKTYADSIQAGQTPAQAYESALKNHVISVFPKAATMESPPNMILDDNSPIRVIFPRKPVQKTGKPGKSESKTGQAGQDGKK